MTVATPVYLIKVVWVFGGCAPRSSSLVSHAPHGALTPSLVHAPTPPTPPQMKKKKEKKKKHCAPSAQQTIFENERVNKRGLASS